MLFRSFACQYRFIPCRLLVFHLPAVGMDCRLSGYVLSPFSVSSVRIYYQCLGGNITCSVGMGMPRTPLFESFCFRRHRGDPAFLFAGRIHRMGSLSDRLDAVGNACTGEMASAGYRPYRCGAGRDIFSERNKDHLTDESYAERSGRASCRERV